MGGEKLRKVEKRCHGLTNHRWAGHLAAPVIVSISSTLTLLTIEVILFWLIMCSNFPRRPHGLYRLYHTLTVVHIANGPPQTPLLPHICVSSPPCWGAVGASPSWDQHETGGGLVKEEEREGFGDEEPRGL